MTLGSFSSFKFFIFLFDIITRKGTPFTFKSNVPPPVRRNLVIEFFTVNLAHLFAMMDFFELFSRRSHFPFGSTRATLSTDCYLGTEHNFDTELALHIMQLGD